jgi:tetratricopeptide (TPR) repeat protein
MDAAFPSGEVGNWPVCQRLVPQAIVGGRLIEEFGLRSEEAARLLNQAGFYLHGRGQFGLVEPLYRQSLEVRRQVLGEQHPDFANSLNNLAFLYDTVGRYEEAEPLYRQAIEIAVQTLGPSHPHTKTCRANYDALRSKLGSRRGGG